MFNDSQSTLRHSPVKSADTAAADESEPLEPRPFVGISAPLQRLLLQARITGPHLHLAAIEGEAGTGKHLFAQTIHRHSRFSNLPFRRFDAREWLATENDLAAFQGTLYLDRIDLLAPLGQKLLLNLAKFLSAETSAQAPRFLLLASSHDSLRLLASRGLFLPDLAFRFAAIRFALPPLREHREDITPISQVLIDSICRKYHQPTAVLAHGTIPRLLQHSWPGNVRELASVLESAVLDSTTGVIRPSDLAIPTIQAVAAAACSTPSPIQPPAAELQPEMPEDLSLDSAIQRHLVHVLELNRGNKLRAARQLGISRSTLYRLLSEEPAISEDESTT